MAVQRKAIVNAVKRIGPVVPLVVTAIRDNPEIWETVKQQTAKLTQRKGGTLEDVIATLEVLRGQVSYLAESADDAGEARRAQEWAKRLDRYEHAAHVLETPGTPKAEQKDLAKKVADLRSEIFTAFIVEQGEDAQAGDAQSGTTPSS